MPAIRPCVSVRRSISASDSPASWPASRSIALASRISGVRATSASAIASSAASFVALSICASARDAALAARQISGTDEVARAMREGYAVGGGRDLVENEVVAVHGLLGRARDHLAHLGGLQPAHPAQLGGGVVADPLADPAAIVH